MSSSGKLQYMGFFLFNVCLSVPILIFVILLYSQVAKIADAVENALGSKII